MVQFKHLTTTMSKYILVFLPGNYVFSNLYFYDSDDTQYCAVFEHCTTLCTLYSRVLYAM